MNSQRLGSILPPMSVCIRRAEPWCISTIPGMNLPWPRASYRDRYVPGFFATNQVVDPYNPLSLGPSIENPSRGKLIECMCPAPAHANGYGMKRQSFDQILRIASGFKRAPILLRCWKIKAFHNHLPNALKKNPQNTYTIAYIPPWALELLVPVHSTILPIKMEFQSNSTSLNQVAFVDENFDDITQLEALHVSPFINEGENPFVTCPVWNPYSFNPLCWTRSSP